MEDLNNDSVIDLARRVNYKLYKLTDDSPACLAIGQETIQLIAGREVAIGLDSDLGVIIKGKTSFACMPNEIKIGGMWRFNNQLLSTIPSTAMTPISVLDFNIPGKDMANFLKDFIKDAAVWLAI